MHVDENVGSKRSPLMKRLLILLALVCAWIFTLACPAAWAQLGGLPLPPLPSVGGVTDQTHVVTDTLERPVENVRRLRMQDLLREHPRQLEAGPGGQPIVRSQILALGVSQSAIDNARAAGFEIVRADSIDETTSMVTLRAPNGMSTRRALARLRQADPQSVYDFDHLYLESGAGRLAPFFAQASAARTGPRIGLIDGGVGASAGLAAQQAFASETPVATAHATTIAGLLSAAAPGARLYAADIYGGAPTGGASSALIRALAWLARENTPVINISLVGPRNTIVEAVIARMIGRGFVIVAAVGNDGPAAAPLFPAAYEGVVGVTGVDARGRVLIEAGRGPQVDFAAAGLTGSARGTSFASPIIAAHLAAHINAPDTRAAQSALSALRGEARDLGRQGRDDIYGYGLIGAP